MAFLLKNYPKGYLRIKDVSNIVGVGYQTVSRWIAEGKIKSSRVGNGTRYRISFEEFIKFSGSPSISPYKPTMSTEELSSYLGILVEEVEELRKRMIIPFIYRKNEIVFSKDDIDEWMFSLVRTTIKDLLKNP